MIVLTGQHCSDANPILDGIGTGGVLISCGNAVVVTSSGDHNRFKLSSMDAWARLACSIACSWAGAGAGAAHGDRPLRF